uniref:hypothetical protein n=1 Tax=Paractinoplanes polyasparticus TaxID=2856853 RepID=UPI001C866752|nr:hypothetical protein [Actinoplanes polyasparticus]
MSDDPEAALGSRTTGQKAGAAAIFDKTEPCAEKIKTILEMIVGLIVVLGVLLRVLPDVAHLRVPDDVAIFGIVASGLAVVAAIELAYTLFTPGPDEVIDPLMLGLSATLLFQVSKMEKFDWSAGVAVVSFVVALGGLFYIRRTFIDRRRRQLAPLSNVEQAQDTNADQRRG